ncbi:MAG: rRNA maturation RNase YbeY [Deltaproteobacteria bacterium]|nr:rRNA maturation RNase YbeY [Deltaproteobacteria bacterium]MBP6835555.1 rRNA maturation RNase YbeY [Deltaproteobacteria bacterium]
MGAPSGRRLRGTLARTMRVEVSRQATKSRVVSTEEVRSAAEAMLRSLKLPRAELSVLLCDDATIHALNRDYRKKNKPTDVLAFAMREGEDGHLAGDLLGDVIISLETATRQAKERAVVTRDEVMMLLAHGLLHLLGWDHQTDADDKRMRAETDRMLAVIRRAAAAKAKRAAG